MRKDTDFIYEAITKVEELSGIHIEFDSTRPSYDGLVQIKDQEFLVEAKSAVRTSNLGLVISQIEQARDTNRRPILLVSKYVAKAAVQEFKKRNINFIDSAGNALIKYGQVFIYIEGQKAQSKEKTNQSRAFQEAGLKIIFTLLSFPNSIELSYRGLAESADVSIGSLSNVMGELEQLNYILRTNNRKILKNQKDLLERWVVAYNDVLRPRVFRKRMKFIEPEQAKNWVSLTNFETSKPIHWGGEPGAAMLGSNLRPEKFTLYTNIELPELAKTFKLVPDQDGNVEVLNQFWTSGEEQNSITPPLLIYTDLINSGSGRNLEVAKQILEDELQYIK
tara:strand:- start:220 stop:1224 length:1005 start_codon:yes stop_codon:yes gene_type:complete